MKKKIALLSSCSIMCLGIAAFAVISFKNDETRETTGIDDYYSITINAEDITAGSGSYVAHTDQLNNPVTFNYENVQFEEDGGDKYLVFSENAWFGNDKDSEIRKIESVTVFGNGGVFTYDYGWNVKTGSIQYSGGDYYNYANGTSFLCGDCETNYFVLMHRDGEADVKISKIIFTYSKDCVPGVKRELDSISLSGQTTSINRGNSFVFGGTVTANYSNGSTADVTSQTTFSGYNMSIGGNYTVTASYTEGDITKTATYTLTVNKVWTTLWSGSKSLTYTRDSSSVPSDVNVTTLSSLPNTSDLRITFSITTSGPGSSSSRFQYSTWNGSTATSKPSSPTRKNNFNPTSDMTRVISCEIYSTVSMKEVRLSYTSSSGLFKLEARHYNSLSSTGWSIKMTITKIERYY